MFHARTLPTSRLCGINACLWRRQVHRVALPGASWEDAECYTSDRADVLRLRSFLSLGRFEFDLLVLIQRPVARARDCGEVDEHVRRPVIGGDETKTLIGVEPLHCACCHQFKSLIHATARPRRADREPIGPGSGTEPYPRSWSSAAPAAAPGQHHPRV